MTQQLTVAEMNAQPSTMNSVSMMFSADGMDRIMKFAELMSAGRVSVPVHFQNKPSDCMAIVMQSMRWGMDPFVVAQKTHVINGTLGYEAQLVNAVVTSSTAVQGRFHFEYGGDWERIGGVAPDKRDESGLFIKVGAILRSETEITWGEPVYLADVKTRNSPLWKTQPKQQIAYLGIKYWARLYCPEVILGVYTPDEVEQRTEKEVNPPAQRASINQMSAAESRDNVVSEQKQESKEQTDTSSLESEFLAQIEAAENCEQAATIRAALDEQKSSLGNTLFTALKGKAVAKYHRIDSKNAIEAAINSLDVSDPEAKEQFAKAEQLLNSRKQKLGTELYEAFSLTMNDLRPEFQ
ncbi:recombinase RecT [Rouxiella badensis]|uniref:RecT family recombinase n=1 Tax=Rouxiella badensis TaxID=1646377 RepID=UPI001D149A81|nr:RecT family recombinase [Rouxiella badensis]MCC3733682.1 recombinase RecT [Rouxiella badensis]MCC3759664.1 recombinase RecT [Rouxiella badensis]